MVSKGIEKYSVVGVRLLEVMLENTNSNPSFVFKSRVLLGRRFFVCVLVTIILLKF